MQTLSPIQQANQKHDHRTNEVARVATGYQQQCPGLSRSDALRLAEKHIPAVKP